jgi:hypothetical protein
MSINYVTETSDSPRQKRLKLRLLLLANIAFGIVAVFSWTFVAFLVADPISWATWSPLTHSSAPPFFTYPFMLLWAMPLTGILGAWMADKLGHLKMAQGIALMPVLVLTIIFAWYYIMPVHLH